MLILLVLTAYCGYFVSSIVFKVAFMRTFVSHKKRNIFPHGNIRHQTSPHIIAGIAVLRPKARQKRAAALSFP